MQFKISIKSFEIKNSQSMVKTKGSSKFTVSYFNRKNRQSHYDSGKGPTIADKILARNQAKLNKRKI